MRVDDANDKICAQVSCGNPQDSYTCTWLFQKMQVSRLALLSATENFKRHLFENAMEKVLLYKRYIGAFLAIACMSHATKVTLTIQRKEEKEIT